MPVTIDSDQSTRRSLSVPNGLYDKLNAIAEHRHVTINRAIIDLLKDAITAYEQRRQAFLELADRFQKATDPAEIDRLRTQLAQMTFGE